MQKNQRLYLPLYSNGGEYKHSSFHFFETVISTFYIGALLIPVDRCLFSDIFGGFAFIWHYVVLLL